MDLNDNGVPDECELTFIRGDANASGAFDIADSLSTLFCQFRGTDCGDCHDAHDSNDDGARDIADATFSLTCLFLAGRCPSAPGVSECGSDPTLDGLTCFSFLPCE